MENIIRFFIIDNSLIHLFICKQLCNKFSLVMSTLCICYLFSYKPDMYNIEIFCILFTYS